MAESVDMVVVIMVSAAGIPTQDMRVGTELYHRVRTGRSGKCVSVETCTDKRIYIPRLIQKGGGLGSLLAACQKTEEKGRE